MVLWAGAKASFQTARLTAIFRIKSWSSPQNARGIRAWKSSARPSKDSTFASATMPSSRTANGGWSSALQRRRSPISSASVLAASLSTPQAAAGEATGPRGGSRSAGAFGDLWRHGVRHRRNLLSGKATYPIENDLDSSNPSDFGSRPQSPWQSPRPYVSRCCAQVGRPKMANSPSPPACSRCAIWEAIFDHRTRRASQDRLVHTPASPSEESLREHDHAEATARQSFIDLSA
jgi:hypothetical protein